MWYQNVQHAFERTSHICYIKIKISLTIDGTNGASMPPNLQDMEQTPKPAFLFQTKDERYVASEYRTATCGSTVRNDLCFV